MQNTVEVEKFLLPPQLSFGNLLIYAGLQTAANFSPVSWFSALPDFIVNNLINFQDF